ncbi:MAG: NAD(P)-dependent oxidoreductase [Holophaga sp.]|nr:NAD(P)-dependent oxidoreductase [Holophaga sp.]
MGSSAVTGSAALPEADFSPLDSGTRGTLAGRTVLLTGGTGFVGSWLTEQLFRLGPEVRLILLSRDPDAFLQANPHYRSWTSLRLVQGDVRTWDGPLEPVDLVLHGATTASKVMNDERPLDMVETIVHGTERMLRLAARAGARRFLFLSSGLAQGIQPPKVEAMEEPMTGRLDSLDPRSAYGNAKHFAEHLCLQHGQAAGFEVVVARMYAFLGPLLPLDAHFAAGNFMRDGLRGEPIRIQGDGTPLRTYLHAADMARYLWTLLARGAPGRAYNVGGADPVSIRQLADLVGGLCGVPVQVAGTPGPGLPSRYVPCMKRTREELGLQPALGLLESIERTLAWHRSRMERKSS